MANEELNVEVRDLINAVNELSPGKVEVQLIGSLKAGYVRHDQAQMMQDGDKIMIQVADMTAVNYTASHELLHLYMVLRGFPQVFFGLTTGDDQVDEQLMMMVTELFDIVSHFVVVSEQRKHGLIDDSIEQLYLNGIHETLDPEPNPVDDSMTLRLLTLLDARVFYGDHFETVRADLEKNYPVAMKAADKLYAAISAKTIDSPFALRRTVVKLFKLFDDQMDAWDLPALHNNEFTTLTSVLSERQLRLEVRQQFEIFHSDMVDRATGERAYVGFNRADNQNSFVLSAPKKQKDSAEFFQSLYDLSVEDLMKQLKMPYIIR